MAMSGDQIYWNFQRGRGGAGLTAIADVMKNVQTTYSELGQSVAEAANTIDAGWKGEAGGAASRGAGPLAVGYSEAAPPLGTAQDLTNKQVSTFNETKSAVKPIPPMPDKPSGFDNFTETVSFGLADTGVDDYEKGLAAHNAANQHNVDKMNSYATASEANSNLPQNYGTTALPDAPDVSIRADKQSEGGGGDFGHQFSGGGSGSATHAATAGGGGGTGGSFGAGGSGGASHAPAASGTGPGGSDGPGGSFGSGPAGATTAPSGYPGYPGGGPGAQGPGTGTGAGVAGGMPSGGTGDQDSTRRNSGYGGPAFGATTGAPGESAAGVPGRLGAGPGAAGAGATQEGGRLGSGGVIGEEAAAARGAAGAAGGRGGMGGAVPPGARGKGDEDSEHETPDYLVDPDPDDTFAGDLPRTAPPVIGE